MKLLLTPKTLTFTFEIPAMEKTEGVQKILGFSRGWHHWNSVRLGIRKENDYCVLYLYAYVHGERIIKRLGKVIIGSVCHCIIDFGSDIFIAANDLVANTDAPLISNPIGYLLRPYLETDAPENKRKPFDVKIWDIKVNGRVVEV